MIAEVVPLAPLVVEIPWAILGLATVATFLVLLGLKTGYHYSLGAIFQGLARVLDFKVWKFHVDLSGGIHKLDNYIESKLASGLLASETVLAKWWHGQEKIVEWTYDSLAWFAHQTLAAFDSLVHGTIPQTVTVVTRPIATSVATLRRELRATARALERDLVHRAQALEADLERDFGKAWRGIDHIQSVSVPRLAHLVHVLEGDLADVRGYTRRVLARRLSRLEKLVGAGVIGAVAIAALTRVFPYWQCRNVKRLLRGTCRANRAWLDLLFGVGVEALVVADLCDFIGALSAAAAEVEPALLAFVDAEDALIGCHGATKPPPLSLAPLGLPPYSGRVSLGV